MTVLDVLAVVLLFCWRLWVGRTSPSTVDDIPEDWQADSSVERARATAGWALGTRGDWDRHVRPVLAREFAELMRARRDPGAPMAGGEVGFGAELWALVDPNRPFDRDTDLPGPGREALDAVLDRLERL